MAGEPSHYFSPSPVTPSRPAVVTLALPDLTVDLETDRGVFSAERVDPGTLVLLRAVEPRPGVLVDLGCGYGPIAVTLARRQPGAQVWAVDVNDRARALCTANAARAGCTNVHSVAPDEVPDDLVVDAVYSNPPIRIGNDALHRLLLTWLDRLRPGGQAWLVVKKHLGSDSLARWLTDAGWPATRHTSRQGYRVLRIDRAAP